MTAPRTIPPTSGQATGTHVSLRRRLLEALLALIAGVALLTALAPLPSLGIQLTAWVVFILVLVLCALLDRQRCTCSARSTHRHPVGSNPRTEQALFAIRATQSADDLDIDDWLGPFNPDDGLSLDQSPYFVHDSGRYSS